MEATAILSIFSQGETYIFSLASPTKSPLHPRLAIHAPSGVSGATTLNAEQQAQLKNTIDGAVKLLCSLHVGAGRTRGDSKAADPLEQLGRFLFSFLLPPALQDALCNLPDELPLILATNENGLPWELLHDGTQYLALHRSIGRRLWSATSARRNAISESSHRSFLFIANPTEDLDQADIESERLMELFEPELMAGAYPKFLARSRATKWEVLQALGGGYDIVHYSGHAEPGMLLLADGELSTEDMQKTLQGKPFVFLNACSSARGKSSVASDPLSFAGLTAGTLASAFIMGGAAGFIGTLWPVFDESSRQFAEWFYTRARNGMTVGEALRRTRGQMYETDPNNPIWASFVFYGDPRLKITALAPPQTRHVTVLTAHLGGLFPLFDQLALESAAEIRNQALDLLRRISERYGAVLHGPLNDLLTIYFGVPTAHGNDPQHAIRAALEMIGALHAFNQRWARSLPAPLSLRVGISTGRVLAAPLGAKIQLAGQVESIAALLATHADVGQIVLDQATYRQVRDHFTFQPLEALTLTHGKPLNGYRLIGALIKRLAKSQIIGREHELAQLGRWWGETMRGRGRVVALVGAAGIGKSSLKEAFRYNIATLKTSSQWISATCHVYNQTQSYALLGQIIRGLAGIEAHDDQATQRRKLEQFVQSVGTSRPNEAQINKRLALLGRVVALHFPIPAVDNLEPKLRQRELIRIVGSLLRNQAAQQPLILALEDLQWADEASLSVLDQIVNAVGRMRILLLATYRPEWSHEWGKRSSYKHISLDELSEEAQYTLLSHLLGAVPPEELAYAVLSRTGGNPFFIEEVIYSLQERNLLLKKGNAWVPATDMSQVPLPDKVERVIQARLDRLSTESRRLLQSAAVVGQEFEYEVLAGLEDKSAQLDDNLELLTSRSLIYEAGGWPFFYSFQHGLVHQAAYNLLPEGLRRHVHRLTAQVLRRLYDEEQIIERLAHHYYHSHDRLSAISVGLRAAKRAANEWANQTALDWYERLLEKLDSFEREPLSEREQRKGISPFQLLRWRIEALEGQAEVLGIVGQTDQAIANYEQALTLAVEMPITRRADLYRKLAILRDNNGQFEAAKEGLNQGLEVLDGLICLEGGRIHVYMGLLHYRKGQLSAALASCEEGIAIIKNTESIRDLAQAHNLKGILYRNLAESQQAIMTYERSIALYKQAEYLPGQEYASYNLACVYQDLGLWNKAQELFEQSSRLSHIMGKEWRQAAALNNQGEIFRRQGKLEQAIEACQQARQIWQESGFEEFVGVALINLGATYLKKGALTEARTYLGESLTLFQRIEANLHLPENLRYLAELEVLKQQATQAQQLAQEAVDWALKLERRVEEGPARRTLGQALRALGELEEAQKQLDESLTILEENNNPYEIGLTLVELALLRQAQHKVDDHEAWREQAIAYCQRALTIFKQLGAALDRARTQEIHQSL